MVVGVLCNQVVNPDFVGRQHELPSVDDIPRCLCRVGGGGGNVEPYLADSSDFL